MRDDNSISALLRHWGAGTLDSIVNPRASLLGVGLEHRVVQGGLQACPFLERYTSADVTHALIAMPRHQRALILVAEVIGIPLEAIARSLSLRCEAEAIGAIADAKEAFFQSLCLHS